MEGSSSLIGRRGGFGEIDASPDGGGAWSGGRGCPLKGPLRRSKPGPLCLMISPQDQSAEKSEAGGLSGAGAGESLMGPGGPS